MKRNLFKIITQPFKNDVLNVSSAILYLLKHFWIEFYFSSTILKQFSNKQIGKFQKILSHFYWKIWICRHGGKFAAAFTFIQELQVIQMPEMTLKFHSWIFGFKRWWQVPKAPRLPLRLHWPIGAFCDNTTNSEHRPRQQDLSWNTPEVGSRCYPTPTTKELVQAQPGK